MLSQKCNSPTSPSSSGNAGPIPNAEDNGDAKIDIAPTDLRRDPSLGVVQPDMTPKSAPTTSPGPGLHPNQPSLLIASTHQNVLPVPHTFPGPYQMVEPKPTHMDLVVPNPNHVPHVFQEQTAEHSVTSRFIDPPMQGNLQIDPQLLEDSFPRRAQMVPTNPGHQQIPMYGAHGMNPYFQFNPYSMDSAYPPHNGLPYMPHLQHTVQTSSDVERKGQDGFWPFSPPPNTYFNSSYPPGSMFQLPMMPPTSTLDNNRTLKAMVDIPKPFDNPPDPGYPNPAQPGLEILPPQGTPSPQKKRRRAAETNNANSNTSVAAKTPSRRTPRKPAPRKKI